jgi:hypothetical protein
MDITAALERILSNVQRPARYTGREWNSIVKDWDQVEVKGIVGCLSLGRAKPNHLG